MKILVLNCGSSSIKYQLFNTEKKEVLAKGLVDKIGLEGASIKNERNDGETINLEGEIVDHQAGIEFLLGVLISKNHGSLKKLTEIDAVGHRVVQQLHRPELRRGKRNHHDGSPGLRRSSGAEGHVYHPTGDGHGASPGF